MSDYLIPDEELTRLAYLAFAEEQREAGYTYAAAALEGLARGEPQPDMVLPFDTTMRIAYGKRLAEWIEDYIRTEVIEARRDKLAEKLESAIARLEKIADSEASAPSDRHRFPELPPQRSET